MAECERCVHHARTYHNTNSLSDQHLIPERHCLIPELQCRISALQCPNPEPQCLGYCGNRGIIHKKGRTDGIVVNRQCRRRSTRAWEGPDHDEVWRLQSVWSETA